MQTYYWVNCLGEIQCMTHSDLLDAARQLGSRPIVMLRWWASIPLAWVTA